MNGRTYQRKALEESCLIEAQSKLYETIDVLSGRDDMLAQAIIESDSMDNVKPELLSAAIRTCTIEQQAVPVLLGSAYKNIGVQLLMDAILKYLPAPNERNQIYNCFG